LTTRAVSVYLCAADEKSVDRDRRRVIILRVATENDAEPIAEILAHYIEHTAITFHEVPLTSIEMRARMAQTQTRYPWFVAVEESARGSLVLGYAYASEHVPRAAYRWSVDTSIYLHHEHTRRGLGRRLYSALFLSLAELGYVGAYAGVTLPNDASVALHQAMGFAPVGVYRGVGYKHGAWRDVAWFERALRERSHGPAEPTPFAHAPSEAVVRWCGGLE
jgi:L-amino acid N-acyltransferase YncA